MRVSLIQLDAQNNKQANVEKALAFIDEAAKAGTDFALLPEVFSLRRSPNTSEEAEPLQGATITAMSEKAAEHGISILVGSFCEKPNPEDLEEGEEASVFNTSVLLDRNGDINATYRKIHLFESGLSDAAVSESRVFLSGNKPQVGHIDGVPLGLTICYDVRFPELYREYSFAGTRMFSVPSSFTVPTGQAHWDVLLRARAVENLSFVLAPNQIGIGAGNIPTYGNSMIVDFWGRVLACGSSDKEEVVTATLDFNEQEKCRAHFPALSHVRM